MPSGLEVLGITNTEVPLVKFSLEIEGGMLLEEASKIGVSNMLAGLMTKGTKNRTPAELEEAIELLGAEINFRASDEKLMLQGSTLAKNFKETMALVQEILLEPRWDEEEFRLIKQQVLSRIQQQEADPNSIADNEFKKLIYGENHILSNNNLGTRESVQNISLSDLKDYYRFNFSPQVASFLVAGAIEKDETLSALRALSANWPPKSVQIPEISRPEAPNQTKIYFYDVPGAKQSVFRFGSPALRATDEDFYLAEVMNYRLGGGGFASQLTQELREAKGYTYNAGSRFSGGKYQGIFHISTPVRSNITLEAAALVKEIIENYPEEFNQEDIEVTRSFMIKSNARRFETLNSKLDMLSDISNYDLEYDYINKREAQVNELDILKVQELARKYINPEKMYFLIVGDAETQLERLEDLGLGSPVLLNPEE